MFNNIIITLKKACDKLIIIYQGEGQTFYSFI